MIIHKRKKLFIYISLSFHSGVAWVPCAFCKLSYLMYSATSDASSGVAPTNNMDDDLLNSLSFTPFSCMGVKSVSSSSSSSTNTQHRPRRHNGNKVRSSKKHSLGRRRPDTISRSRSRPYRGRSSGDDDDNDDDDDDGDKGKMQRRPTVTARHLSFEHDVLQSDEMAAIERRCAAADERARVEQMTIDWLNDNGRNIGCTDSRGYPIKPKNGNSGNKTGKNNPTIEKKTLNNTGGGGGATSGLLKRSHSAPFTPSLSRDKHTMTLPTLPMPSLNHHLPLHHHNHHYHHHHQHQPSGLSSVSSMPLIKSGLAGKRKREQTVADTSSPLSPSSSSSSSSSSSHSPVSIPESPGLLPPPLSPAIHPAVSNAAAAAVVTTTTTTTTTAPSSSRAVPTTLLIKKKPMNLVNDVPASLSDGELHQSIHGDVTPLLTPPTTTTTTTMAIPFVSASSSKTTEQNVHDNERLLKKWRTSAPSTTLASIENTSSVALASSVTTAMVATMRCTSAATDIKNEQICSREQTAKTVTKTAVGGIGKKECDNANDDCGELKMKSDVVAAVVGKTEACQVQEKEEEESEDEEEKEEKARLARIPGWIQHAKDGAVRQELKKDRKNLDKARKTTAATERQIRKEAKIIALERKERLKNNKNSGGGNSKKKNAGVVVVMMGNKAKKNLIIPLKTQITPPSLVPSLILPPVRRSARPPPSPPPPPPRQSVSTLIQPSLDAYTIRLRKTI